MPRQVLLLIKSQSTKFANQAGYYLLNGRWHAVHQHKPAPKGVPVLRQVPESHNPQAGHQDLMTDTMWAKVYAHPDNSNKANFTKKLHQMKAAYEAGDAHGILGLNYPADTTHKKLAHIGNYLLNLLGSEHQIVIGQKKGEHTALSQTPAAQPAPYIAPPAPDTTPAAPDIAPAESKVEPKQPAADKPKPQKAKKGPVGQALEAAANEPPAAEPAPTPDLAMPTFVEGKTTQGVTAYYEKQAQTILDLVAAGDVAGLEKLKADGLKPNSKGKVGNTYKGKTENSKLLLALHDQALAQAGGASADTPPAASTDAETPAATKTPGQMTRTIQSAINEAVAEEDDVSLKYFVKEYPEGTPVHEAAKAGLASIAAKEAPAPSTPADAKPAASQLIAAAGSVGAAQQAAVKYLTDNGQTPEAYDAVITALKEHGYSNTADAMSSIKQDEHGPKEAPTDAGPKEGDTKQGADGMLVFKNGRWHKQEEPKAAEPEPAAAEPAAQEEPHPIDAIEMPDTSKFTYPSHQKSVSEALAKLKAQVKAEGPSALKGLTKKMSASGKLITKLPGQFGQIKVIGHEAKPNIIGSEVFAYVEALKAAAGKPKKAAPKQKAAAPAPAASTNTADIESMDNWTEQSMPVAKGSNPGGKYKDADGVEWYCKFPSDEDHAKAEVLAAKFYTLAGFSAQDAKLVTKNGKIGIASKWVNIQKGAPDQLAALENAQSGLAVDAWLGNRDVVGLAFDNLQVGADGKAHRVDAGASFMFRAQGGKKEFSAHVGEIDSLRDKSINPQAAAVFGSMTKADITASVAKVAAMSDNDIYAMVMEHGPGTLEQKADLIDTLIARKEDLLAKYPKAAKKAKDKAEKEKPNPEALKVTAEQLPPVHDFANWNGEGKGLSSKTHVNEANQKAEQDLLNFALKGNLIALKDYHFEAVDKDSGASLGMKPIEQHPSQHVKGYWSDLVATLSYIAYPPEALKRFKSVVAASVKKVSEAFKPAGYGVTTNKVEANSRLAFWIALGHTKPVETLVPGGASMEFQSTPVGTPPITSAMKQAAKDAYANLSSSRLVKRFINGIQASGSYNDNFRDGKMITNDGHDAVGMVLDAYNYATEKPEGFELYKWVSFPGDMGKQMLDAPAGTVFQNPGSMCCSYHPTATQGFGPDRVRIRYAKGAKGVDSFGSGSFKSEQEITTLPGQRFVILSCKKVQCPVKGKQRIELDVLMLPPDEGYVAELEANKGKHGQSS